MENEEQIKKEVQQEVKRNNNKHTGAKTGIAAAVILALLGGGYFGFGGGKGVLNPSGQEGEGSSAPQTVIESVSDTEIETPTLTEEEKDDVLKIVITETGIQYEGSDVSVTELEEALLKDYQEGLNVTVKDDHAIKATYDEVTALLSKLNISFTEEE